MNLGLGIDTFSAWLTGCGLPPGLALVVAAGAIWIGPLLGLVLAVAGLGQIIERKVAAAMQRRVGPNTAGMDGVLIFAARLLLPWLGRARQDALVARMATWPVLRLLQRWGIGQLAADGVKMVGKEDLIPAGVDGAVFRVAPYLALMGAFLPFAVIPFSQHVVALECGVSAVYVVAVAGLSVFALFMAGWGSGNKFALLGGMRAVAQVVSYEVPVGLAIAGVVLWCGTLDLHRLVAAQYHPGACSFLGWNILQSPFLAGLAVIYAFAGLAECQRAPFDLAEAESELVSGFNTEYSGFRWGMFAMAEYSEMVLVGCLFSVLFLGGYQSPIGEEWIVAAPVWIEVPLHLGILLAKFTLAVVVMVWIRWTLPRFRVDQVMRLCWLTLVPLGLLCVAGLATTMLLAGTVADGPAYGRFAPQAQLVLSPLGRAASWAIPVALAVVLVVLARRRYGQQHDDLRRLTGSTP